MEAYVCEQLSYGCYQKEQWRPDLESQVRLPNYNYYSVHY